MFYSVSDEPGYIIRGKVQGNDETLTLEEFDDKGECIRHGEMLLRETNIVSYWIVNKANGDIEWERL